MPMNRLNPIASALSSDPVPPPFPTPPDPWVRPTDWLALPTISPGDQIFAGLFAVFAGNPNYVALVANSATVGKVATFELVPGSFGEGYAVDDILQLDVGTGASFRVTATVDGGLAAVALLDVGDDAYIDGDTVTIVGGNNDATATRVDGSWRLNQPGSGFAVGNIEYTTTGGTGSGLTLTGAGRDGVVTAVALESAGTNVSTGQQLLLPLNGSYNAVVDILTITLQNYTVDWGDGTVEDFDGGVTAEHAYDYDTYDAAEATLCSRGYKQAVIVVTPQEGSDLTVFGPRQSSNNEVAAAWVDWSFNSPTCTAFNTYGYGEFLSMLEHIWFGQNALVDLQSGNTFGYLPGLQAIEITELDSVTDANSAFYTNSCLRSVTLPNLPLCTTLFNAFYGCTSLERAVIGDCPLLENGSNMCEGDGALKVFQIGQFGVMRSDTMSASNVFSGCSAITHVTFGDFDSYIFDIGTLFADSGTPLYLRFGDIYSASGYESVNFNNLGIANPNLVQYIKIGNLPDVTSLASMCNDLEGLRIFEMGDAPNCTDFSNAWNACYSLQKFAHGDMSAATTLSGALQYLYALKALTLDVPACMNFSNFVFQSTSLEELTLGDVRGDADFTSALSDTDNLRKLTIGNIIGTTFPTALFVSAPALQEIVIGDGLEITDSVRFSGDKLKTVRAGNFPICESLLASSGSLYSLVVAGARPTGDISSMFLNCKPLVEVSVVDLTGASPGFIYALFQNNQSLRTIPAFDLSTSIDLTDLVANCPALSWCDAFGARVSISFANCNFGVDGLVNLFEKLGEAPTAEEVIADADARAFNSGDNWSQTGIDNDWVISGGVATGVSPTKALVSSFTAPQDGSYVFEFDVITTVAGTLTCSSDNGTDGFVVIAAPGTEHVTAQVDSVLTGDSLKIYGGGVSTWEGSIDNVSIKPLIAAPEITVAGNPGTPYLTAAQKAIAEDKGWTVVTS